MFSPYIIEHNDEVAGGMTQKVQSVVEKKMGLTKNECSPLADGEGVCSSPTVIEKLRKWLHLPTDAAPAQVIEEAKIKTGCASEACLYDSPMIVKLPDDNLKPKGPRDDTTWLSNSNIDLVLAQWAAKLPHFKHVTYQMINFKEYGGELARLDWDELAEKYTKLGCVINTDRKGNAGKHWVCVFIDLDAGTVEYFDSAGQEIPKPIMEWMMEASLELSRVSKRKFRDVLVTSMEHQLGSSECGVYTLFYILARLSGVPYSFFEHTRVPDKDMEEFRAYLFRSL